MALNDVIASLFTPVGKRALQGQLNSTFVPGLLRKFTASGTITPSDAIRGVTVTNEGAAGLVTLTLPPAVPGMRVFCIALAAQEIRLDPSGTERIQTITDTNGDYVTNATTPIASDRIELICVETGKWLPTLLVGDWAEQ